MLIYPLASTSTLGATLLRATLGAGEVAAMTVQVQAVTQVLTVLQKNPVLIVNLVLLDTETINLIFKLNCHERLNSSLYKINMSYKQCLLMLIKQQIYRYCLVEITDVNKEVHTFHGKCAYSFSSSPLRSSRDQNLP